ncbi:MAG: hypothetical protein IJ762_10010 [Bacteroidaceae bacterium]|nr:hypothetical protein [Bacteroidaceae bacterium]
MEIQNEITKEVFERHVPAAKRPKDQTGIFDRLPQFFSTAYAYLLKNLLGEEKETLLGENSVLKEHCIHLVCLNAFERAVRSLDLVLTGTGFGVVSTESTAPASRARVDALLDDVICDEYRTMETITDILIKVEGWGASSQAQKRISVLFYRPSLMVGLSSLRMTAENWSKARSRAVTADALLRAEISEEYMDELLVKTRTASLGSADIVIVEKCNYFTADFISNYELSHGSHNHTMLRSMVEQLESSPDSYPTYRNSRLYRKRHAERFQNQKEDPTFFFM